MQVCAFLMLIGLVRLPRRENKQLVLTNKNVMIMKKMFLSLVAFGDEITMYYGSGALGNALSAAVSGDVINLSGGTFNLSSWTCNKAVTLRGTGIDANFPTTIGALTIDIPETDTCCMSIEGIRVTNDLTIKGTFEKVLFLKSKFNGIYWQTTSTNKKDFKICNCIITRFYMRNNSTVNFFNSYIREYKNPYNYTSTALFLNSIIGIPVSSNSSKHDCCRTSFINCILYGSNQNYSGSLHSTCMAMNCISTTFNCNNSGLFSNLSTAAINCRYVASGLFKTFTGSSDSTEFELTDEAKATYLGTDGKEVGMYGGDLPYSSTPSYPQITKMNVANKTTADGKLSVEIEVSAAE